MDSIEFLQRMTAERVMNTALDLGYHVRPCGHVCRPEALNKPCAQCQDSSEAHELHQALEAADREAARRAARYPWTA